MSLHRAAYLELRMFDSLRPKVLEEIDPEDRSRNEGVSARG